MNRKNSKKSTTPKKNSGTKPKRPRKTSNSIPDQSTPVKTRLRSRTLPKSPISETMKQSKINDYFKPVSPSIKLSQTDSGIRSLQTPTQEIIETNSKETIQTKTRTKKGPKVLEPILGPQKRYSLRKSNSSSKKLKFETNCERNQSSDDNNSSANELSVETMEVSDNCHNSKAEDLPKVTNNDKKTKTKKNDKYICEQNLDEMMDELKITEKSFTNSEFILESLVGKNSSDINQIHDISDTNVNKLCEKLVNNFDDDLDLIPVPLFKKPEIKKPKKSSKENNLYVDKEKEKKMSYFLKNLSRIKRDKEMLNIQSIEEMEMEFKKDNNEDMVLESDIRIKPFEGIDVFNDYIPKTIEKFLIEDMNEISSKESTVFSKLPLNRLLPLIPILSRRLKESDRQQLISYIINSVSTEESLVICSKSEHKISELLSENDFEIYLSLILKDFYRILSRISNNLRNPIDSQPNDIEIKRNLKFLSNVIRIVSQILSKNSFKIEAIDSVEELIKLLIICFALGLDFRLIKNSDQMNDIKNLIEVILNNLFVDEFKAIPIIESLISFCLEQKNNTIMSLQIASLFPINIDFELKRKFCISVIQLFVPKNTNEFDLNLNDIQNILEEIDWKSLSPEDIYVIIQMIGLSMDLPKDQIDYKHTITGILGILENKINSSVPKASDFEFSEIHKLLMILRTKVNVSTKRF